MDEPLDFALERARATKAVMLELVDPPYNWSWTGVDPADFATQIAAVDTQFETLTDAESATTAAAAQWDQDLVSLLTDASLGIRLGRVHFAGQPVKLRLFEGLRTNGQGRDARYKQALEFESSWEKTDAAWTFKPTVTLASFKTRRQAIKNREDAHVAAQKNEQHERAVLHDLADKLNRISVDWYEVATATFAGDTVAGQLVRTVPTTYEPNRPPVELSFLQHSSPGPNQVQLLWRAARGEHFFILGQGPGSPTFELILDGVTDTAWLGQGLVPGLWRFKGYASNQFGNGAESPVVEVSVAVAAAA
jgi:hypothetical protein